MKKILKYFGLSLKSDYDSLIKVNKQLENEIREKDEVLNSLETFENFKPEVSYNNYVEQHNNGGKNKYCFNSKLFQEFYDKYHRKQHQAFIIKKLAHKDPNMLNVFLMEFSNFDWESVHNYMKEVGWKWRHQENSPTIEELKNCVITLINFDFKPNSGMESGGFKVNLGYKEGDIPFCKIEFDKKIGEIL